MKILYDLPAIGKFSTMRPSQAHLASLHLFSEEIAVKTSVLQIVTKTTIYVVVIISRLRDDQFSLFGVLKILCEKHDHYIMFSP